MFSATLSQFKRMCRRDELDKCKQSNKGLEIAKCSAYLHHFAKGGAHFRIYLFILKFLPVCIDLRLDSLNTVKDEPSFAY